jgi:hypothetical protein
VKVGDKFAFPLLLDLHPFTEQARAEGKPLGDYHIPAPAVATTQEPASAAVTEAEAVKEAEAAVKEAADVEAGDDENKKTKGKRGKKNKGKGKSKAEEEAKAKEEEKEVAYELEQGPVDVTSPHLYELFSVIIHCGSSAGTYFPTTNSAPANVAMYINVAHIVEMCRRISIIPLYERVRPLPRLHPRRSSRGPRGPVNDHLGREGKGGGEGGGDGVGAGGVRRPPAG